MRPSKAFVALTLVFALAFTLGPSANTKAAADPFVAGEILVKFQPGAAASAQADAHRQSGGTLLGEVALTGVQLVGVPAGREQASIARYQRNPNVLYAEPNFIRSVPEPTAHEAGTEVVPGDYYFDEEWGMHNTGQQFQCIPWISGELCFYIGTEDADIDAPEAWAMSNGGSGVQVAVIDTGIDYNHPDLAANYIGGHDYIFNDNDPMDDQGHGTHVSGTIAAQMNNLTGNPGEEEGVVGVAPNAQILAYKVCRDDGTCDDFAIEQAIGRAVTDGAEVINMSLGAPSFSQSLDDAVQAAWDAGLVIVAGAGNEGNTNLFYPAALDNVISVAAFDEDHRRASFSTYGSWVDLSAPGHQIMSSYPLSACGGTSTTPGDTGCYTWASGTSMATPHVSGAAALVLARDDVSSNTQAVDIILDSADPDGVASTRLDSWTIHGGLNVHGAMSLGAANQPPVADAGPDQTVTDTMDDGIEGSEFVTLDGSASFDPDPDGSIVSYEWFEGDASVATGATPTISLAVGSHTLTLTVMDDQGATASDSVIIAVQAANNQPPVADAGPDQTVTDSDGDGSENVTLDGSGSSDPDGSIVSYEWLDGATTIATGATPTVSLAVGTHTLTLVVTDDLGSTASDSVTITVEALVVEPGTVSVSSISYSTTGGRNNDKHLDVVVALEDGDGNPVSGASVSISLQLSGIPIATGSGSTGGNGTVTFSLKNAPSGCYSTTVTSVSADGLEWDGVTPANGHCK